MAERPDTYMPLYTARWLRSTMDLSAQERDAYMLLSIKYWDNGGPLKNDDAKLARTALCTPEVWETIKHSVKEFFEECIEDGLSILRHEKLDEWIDGAERKYAQAKAKAKTASDARWGKKSTTETVEQSSEHSLRSSKVKEKGNKSKDLGGSKPRDRSGAAASPPMVEVHPSWNGAQAKLSALIGDGQFEVWFAGTKLDTGPPVVIEVGKPFAKSHIEKTFGRKLASLFGPFEIQVSKDVAA